jgi:pimeloyl-ACP methyl ester carboxylesterase
MPDPVPPPAGSPALSRRRLLTGIAGLGGIAALGGAGYAVMPDSLRIRLGWGPDPYIPDALEGQVHLETVGSQARGHDVNLFTAVPHGFGDGAGLPVVVVLHGASATASDFEPFGLARFLTTAVEAGTEPFVLAGADGGAQSWEPDRATGDDPRRMVIEERPGWLDDRGYDAGRRALWGWSMGGYGALRIAELDPGWARAVAAFSPAVGIGDAVFDAVAALAPTPLAVWCGTEDALYSSVRALVDSLPRRPEIVSYGDGGHTRVFWNDQTLEAFDFLGRHLQT